MTKSKSALLALLIIMPNISNTLTAQESSISQGIKLFEAKDYKSAETFFTQHAKTSVNKAEANYYLGRIQFANRDFELAEEYFEKCIDDQPKSAKCYSWLGSTNIALVNEVSFFSKMSVGTKAKESFQKSIEIDPNHVHGLANLGRFYTAAPSFAGGSIDKAQKIADQLLVIDNIEGRKLLLGIYLSNKDDSKAIKEFAYLAENLKDSPENAGFYNSYGYFLLAQENIPLAVTQFEKQVQLIPNNANAYDSLGDGYYASEQLEQARDAYKMALSINPDFSSSKKNLAKTEKKIAKKG